MRRFSRSRDGETRPDDGSGIGEETSASFGVAGWTLFSRITGLLRVAVAGAILGPTFFANIFQATNTVPNLTYNLMAGSLLTELIIPVLVHSLDRDGIDKTKLLLRQLVGVVIAGFTAAALAVLLASPLIVHLLTLGVHGPVASARAHNECWVLLFLVLPQIGLYGIVAVACAAQNSRNRFALAAGAPAVENIGLIVTLVLCWRIFGSDTRNVSNGYLIFLGVGATMSVAVHAAVQCWGAYRAGLPLWPSWHWHDDAVKALYKRIVPAIGTASLDAGWLFILIVAAGTVPGGVVAIQIGINFYYLPVALSAKSVGTVLLPRMAREAQSESLVGYRETYDRGISWAWFVAVPATFALVLCAKPIAQAIAFGEMRRHHGVTLLAASIASLGLALVGASLWEFAKQACYGRHDVRSPLIACAVMVVIVLIGASASAELLHGAAVLAGLGIVVTLGELARSVGADRAARRGTKRQGPSRWRSLMRHTVVAACTIGPGAVVVRLVEYVVPGHAGAILGLAMGLGMGMIAYVFVQALLGAPELPERLRFGPRVEAGAEPASPSPGTALAPVTATNGHVQTKTRTATATAAPVLPSERLPHERRLVFVIGAAAALVVALTAVVGKQIILVPLGIGFVAVMVLVARRPVWACYLYLATLPFVGGIDRGVVIPLLRPSEGIQLALTTAVLAGVLIRALRGELFAIRFTRLDRALIIMALTASVWPLFWLFARGQIPSISDCFETLILWRLFSLYVLYRTAIRTQEQARRCLWIIVISACMLAALAIADSLGIFQLGGIWTPVASDGSVGRGGATLNSAIAVGDYMAYSLAIVFAWILRGRSRRPLLAAMAGVMLLGSLGTGQFSAWIGALVVLIVVAKSEGKLARLPLYFGPLLAIGALIAWPVVSQRLSGFTTGKGVPASWLGRYDNLAHFYIPMLSGFHWVLGIRPDSVLQAPETWRDVIYLESGVLELFFVGGIPLFLAFVWFSRRALKQTNQVARSRTDDIGVAALAARSAMWCILVLTIIDIHLTLRGGGDLFFVLLGLGANFIVPTESPPAIAADEFREEEFEAWAQTVMVP